MNAKELRKAALGAKDLTSKSVKVKEWGIEVHVFSMSGAERDEFESLCQEKVEDGSAKIKDTRGIKALLVILTAKDKEGNPIFTKEDMPELQKKSGKVLDDIATAAQEVNGIGKKELEQLKGN